MAPLDVSMARHRVSCSHGPNSLRTGHTISSAIDEGVDWPVISRVASPMLFAPIEKAATRPVNVPAIALRNGLILVLKYNI